MNCNIAQSKMIDYCDGDLHREERRTLDEHLSLCADCREAWREMKAFSDTCAEFIVYPETPYPFTALRARMVAIRPLDEIVAFFPKMRAQGLTARLAAAVLLLLFAVALPAVSRGARETVVAAQQPFTEEKTKWHDDFQEELDAQYRQQMMERYHRTA